MPAEKIRDPLGTYLWTLRNKAGLSQKTVADRLGARVGAALTAHRVNAWENGSRPMPFSYWAEFNVVLGSPGREPEAAFINLFGKEPMRNELVKLSAEELAAMKTVEEKSARITRALNKAKENLRLSKEAATREYDLAVAGARAKYKAQTEDFLAELNEAKAPHLARRDARIAEALLAYSQQITDLETQK